MADRRATGERPASDGWVTGGGFGYGRPMSRPVQVPPNCDLTLGMVCEDKSEPGRTRWRMVADERFANPAGVVQGGFLAAFCDSAMGAATITWAGKRKVFSANVELKISFVAPAQVGTVLQCSAVVVGGGRRAAFVEAKVTDGERLVATASSTYLLTPRPEIGHGDGPRAQEPATEVG